MSRFHWSSIIFVFLAGVCVFLLFGAVRTVVILFLLIAYLILFSLGVAVIRLNFFCRAVCRGNSGEMKTAITFDDGPDPETTPRVLSVLAKYDIKATFFCIGKKVLQNPDLVRRMVDEDHIIANHSTHHFWWTNFLRSKGLSREIAETQEAIKSVTGRTPVLFRPPAGLSNPHIKKALRQNGLTCIGWDVRPFDTKRTKKRVVDAIARKAKDGSIILMHDTGRTPQDMATLLQDVIAALQSRGFSFSNLDNFLGIKPYQENHNDVKEPKLPENIVQRLLKRLAKSSFIKKALADDISPADMKHHPSAKFIIGLSLIVFSYVIGWPAVAFFAFLGVYLNVKGIIFLGPASYLFSHLVFIAGAALAGVDGTKYGRIFFRWFMHKVAMSVTIKASPNMSKRVDAQMDNKN